MPPVCDGVGDPEIGIHNEILRCCADTEVGGCSRCNSLRTKLRRGPPTAATGQHCRRGYARQRLCKEDARVMTGKSFAEVAR